MSKYYDCCYKKYDSCGCDKLGKYIDDAVCYAKEAVEITTELFELFREDCTCERLKCSECLIKKGGKAVECLQKSLCKIYKYFDKDCFYCPDYAYRLIERSLCEIEKADRSGERFLELYYCYKCECVECELFEAITLTLERLVAIDIKVNALKTMFKDDDCCCRRC